MNESMSYSQKLMHKCKHIPPEADTVLLCTCDDVLEKPCLVLIVITGLQSSKIEIARDVFIV